MASIRKIKDRYHVQIRKPGFKRACSFSDLETATAWGKYKEDLFDNMKAFDAPEQKLILLNDAIDMKIDSMNDHSERTIQDVRSLKQTFSCFLDRDIYSITFNELYGCFLDLLVTDIQKGGDIKSGTGIIKKPEKITVIRKFRYLGTVYGFLKEKGINIENVALQVVKRIENA